MSSAVTSASSSSIDPHRQLESVNDTFTQTGNYMATIPADASFLSPYPTFQPHSTSSSPSAFSASAELTSENGGYSDFSEYNGDDPFYGVNFDAGAQDIDLNQMILGEVPLPVPEAHRVVEYLHQTHVDRTHSLGPSTTAIYPISPKQSNSPSSHSSNSETQSFGTQSRAPLHQLSFGLANGQLAPSNGLTSAGTLQPTPDMSGSSHASAEGIGPGSMSLLGQSPRVTVTTWGSIEQREIFSMPEDQNSSTFDNQFHNGQNVASGVGLGHVGQISSDGSSYPFGDQGMEESWEIDEDSTRKGVDPQRRKSLSTVDIPNFKDQEEENRLQQKILEVEEWRSQAGDSTDAEDIVPLQSRATLGAPSTGNRRRAKSAGEAPSPSNTRYHLTQQHFATLNSDAVRSQPQKDREEGADIEPVSDSDSIRENRIVEGQTYYNPEAVQVLSEDIANMQLSRHYNDAPAYPLIVNTKSHGETANESMKKWNQTADTFSLISRSATWGTRRRSEPSIADIESIKNGGFLKRLSFKTGKEKKPGIFKESFDQFTSIVRRKSDSKLRRNRSERDHRGRPDPSQGLRKESQSSLAPPPRSPSSNRRRPASPRLDTNVGNHATVRPNHARNESLSAGNTTSPKTALGFMGKALRRARSRSDMNEDAAQAGLAGLWREQGGPPVPTLASPPVDSEDVKLVEHSDLDGEDDEDDEIGDDGDIKMEYDPAIPIIPNFAGFQAHVLRLNPLMESTFLVDRIAHQQTVRYKSLLGSRVKHSATIANGSCAAGRHCVALGGSPTLYDSKGKLRDDRKASDGFQILGDASDGDSNPEGQLAAESFPTGVPMPPAQTLPAEFECQLCFRVKKFLKPSDWTKHVHEDVQPFTCTYSTCREPKSFKRKADWVRHENERHRHLEWWTCQVEDCSHKCYRKDNFLQHLVREHKLPEPKQKTKAAVKKAKGSDEMVWVMVRNCHHETTAKPQDEPCKFCGKVLTSWKKLTVHLAKHMELISLPVLKLVEQQHVDANTIISPVGDLPNRHGPLTPIGMGRQTSTSPAHYSNSISPNVQTISQFSSPMRYQNSPHTGAVPQFTEPIYGQSMAYNSNSTTSGMDFTVHAPIAQHQSQNDMMFPNGSISYPTFENIDTHLSNPQSRVFTPMDQSPNLDQSHGFTTVNQHQSHNHNYSNNIVQQPYQTYPASSHASSNNGLILDSSSFPRKVSLTNSAFLQKPLPPRPSHENLSFVAAQQQPMPGGFQTDNLQHLGVLDDATQFSFPTLNSGPDSLDFAQMPIARNQGSPAFSATTDQNQNHGGVGNVDFGQMPMSRSRSRGSSQGQGGFPGTTHGGYMFHGQ